MSPKVRHMIRLDLNIAGTPYIETTSVDPCKRLKTNKTRVLSYVNVLIAAKLTDR